MFSKEVHLAFVRKSHLRDPESAHRSCHGIVRIGKDRFRPDIGHFVRAGCVDGRTGDHCQTVRGIGSGVTDNGHICCEQSPILHRSGFVADFHGVSLRCAEKCLFPRIDHPHRPVEVKGREPDKPLHVKIQLGPEAASRGCLDNPHAALVEPQKFGHILLVVVRILGRCVHHHHTIFIHKGRSRVGLQIGVLNVSGGVNPFDHYIAVLERNFGITPRNHSPAQQVTVFMNRLRAGGEGLLRGRTAPGGLRT